MAEISNIDILIDGKYHLNYYTAESLGLTLVRKVDDFNDLSKRFGEFSYPFSVPQNKNNNIIFSHANALGKQKVFIGQKFDCTIFNNDKILLKGILELVGINTTGYDVIMHSMLSDFIDAVGDLELKDINTFKPVPFNYEQTIVDHLNYSGVCSSDTHLYEFPFVFYNTVFCPTSVFTGNTDNRGIQFYSYDKYQNHYYAFNSLNSDNEFYYHQFPPALYLLRIFEGCFNTVGWQIGGSWIQRDEIKHIIIPYVGETDVYDRCLVTGTTAMLRPELFLADGVKMIEFISGVINTFNLYFVVDAENKSITFESWNTNFNTEENPYVLDKLINASTVAITKPDGANPSIKFKDIKTSNDEGEFILGDNKVLSNNSNDANLLTFQPCTNKNFNYFFDEIGVDDDISILFGTPRVKRMYLWNEKNVSGTYIGHGAQQIFIPSITKQNVSDNNGKQFNKKDTDTNVYNTEDTIQYGGNMSLYYYYGQSKGDNNSSYFYLNIPTGNSYVIQRTKIGFASPFMMSTYRDKINNYLSQLNSGSTLERDILTCSYLQTLYSMFYRADGKIPKTPYSLVFDDDNNYHETLYTYYHKNKYDRYQNSSILSADLIMDENDWESIQLNRALIYKGEIYHLIELNFDPVKHNGSISIIKDIT